MALGGARPALLAQHHGDRFAGHQRALVQRLRRFALHQRRAAVVAEFLGVGAQFVLDQALQLGRRFQQHVDARALLFELVALGVDLHFLQSRQLAQPGFEDVVGLLLAEPEARHQHGLGLVLGAHDADHLIEVEVGDAQAFEQVQAALDLGQAMVEPAGDRAGAEASATR